MSLLEKISADIMAAMKAREMEKLEALRGIKAALLLANTAEGNKEITAEDELKILQKLVKQRKESAEIYKTQNRQDLYEVEINQATVIEAYLPAQMSEEEIKKIIQDIIAQTGASSIRDMGKVMGMATKQLAGKADNSLVSRLVKEMLPA
ncbi:MAG: GatB/YqeY domain-containing protein [Bacteroidales bacterium]